MKRVHEAPLPLLRRVDLYIRYRQKQIIVKGKRMFFFMWDALGG